MNETSSTGSSNDNWDRRRRENKPHEGDGTIALKDLFEPMSKPKSNSFAVKEILPSSVWVVPDFLQASECQAWIDFVDEGGTAAASSKTRKSRLEYIQHPATKYVANRECFRWQRNDPSVAKVVFDRMQSSGVLRELQAKVQFGSVSYGPCACNPNIRIYKYDKGMAFGRHVDGSHHVEGIGMTEVTVLVCLSDCQGGSTRFYPANSGKNAKSIAFAPQKGALLVHVHGDRCLEHEADPVVSGLKYILRTDIVYAE